ICHAPLLHHGTSCLYLILGSEGPARRPYYRRKHTAVDSIGAHHQPAPVSPLSISPASAVNYDPAGRGTEKKKTPYGLWHASCSCERARVRESPTWEAGSDLTRHFFSPTW